MGEHHYSVEVVWTGNQGTGTATYRGYSRNHEISAPGRPDIAGSSDPQFRGDPQRWNPEQLLVAALSQCHMLWYLHLCADAGVVVTDYHDLPQGTMTDEKFTSVVLRPRVTVADASMVAKAEQLHHPAHEKCYIANSVNFPVTHEPKVQTGP
ncbi:peroxiredoxin [Rhizocola hellebori]|uniref:Peroxiredoxin n=1 Tax=Rhizocola hellebori TaxID=1392758 RepID=A0A8J3Q6B4_9ACTN|nr:OsmC family protein [Rhizocola hellebori]GIH04116.1 peroxiredoxin [Rhizocola hellebori]